LRTEQPNSSYCNNIWNSVGSLLLIL